MGLYDDIAALDRNIADRWKTRMNGKMDKPVLTAADVDFIVSDIVESLKTSDGITQKQGEALVLLSNASIDADDLKSKAGIKRLRHYVNIWEKALKLNLKIATDADFPLFSAALSNELVSRVTFKSPGTKISYSPSDYVAVGQLIIRKEVTVMFSQSGGLADHAREGGSYFSSANIMILNHAIGRKITLVHEATHVIQDWKDVKSLVHHEEADAFIAESVARFSAFAKMPDESEFDGSTVEGSALGAARLIVENKATESNRDWLHAYEKVVATVAKRYKKHGVRITPAERGEGDKERKHFADIRQQLDLIGKIIKAMSPLLRKK